MSNEVFAWWTLLCAVAAANVLGWSWTAATLQRRRPALDAEVYRVRRWQLLLSAGYVAGCAWRSVLPVFDVPRIALFDTWLASVVVGRSVATVAELCFVAQWALLLNEAAKATGSTAGRHTARLIVPLIAVAETCSWCAVLTTSNLGHVLEESIWGLSAALMVASLVPIWPHCSTRWRRLMAAWCVAGLAYVAFMFLVDVPMYWSRWLHDEAQGRAYLSLAQGFHDVATRLTVSHSWDVWKTEVTWMTLYFSVAVWMSIGLVHVPGAERRTGIQST
jgi:hypothetical protein